MKRGKKTFSECGLIKRTGITTKSKVGFVRERHVTDTNNPYDANSAKKKQMTDMGEERSFSPGSPQITEIAIEN